MTKNPVSILVLDGGGTRGLYATAVLNSLQERFSRRWNQRLDLGAGFDVVVGTSTGGILAAGIAAGIPLEKICNLYREYGPRIFSDPLPGGGGTLRDRLRLWLWLIRNRRSASGNNEPLRAALAEIFGDRTLGDLHSDRRAGLCLTATSFVGHEPRVFKTAHRPGYDRDDSFKLVDVCMATSAAPFYLPLARTCNSTGQTGVYCDGGLWANSPILVGLLEGLALADEDQPVVVVSIGTCAPPSGSVPQDLDLGVVDWRGGAGALILSMDTQVSAGWNTAKLLQEQFRRLDKQVSLVRCHETQVSSQQAELLALDSATSEAFELMEFLGDQDAAQTYSWCQEPKNECGEVLEVVFRRMTGRPGHGRSK